MFSFAAGCPYLICGLVVAGVLAVTLGVAAQQASKSKAVTASVAVTTSNNRRNIAVLSKGEPPFFLHRFGDASAAEDHV